MLVLDVIHAMFGLTRIVAYLRICSETCETNQYSSSVDSRTARGPLRHSHRYLLLRHLLVAGWDDVALYWDRWDAIDWFPNSGDYYEFCREFGEPAFTREDPGQV